MQFNEAKSRSQNQGTISTSSTGSESEAVISSTTTSSTTQASDASVSASSSSSTALVYLSSLKTQIEFFWTGKYQAISTLSGWNTSEHEYGVVDMEKFGIGSNPHGMAADATYLYVADQYRVIRLSRSTGLFAGFIGHITTSNSNCSTDANLVSQSWCTGGIASYSAQPGGFLGGAFSVALAAGFLYVVDYYGVKKFNASTGAFVGMIGYLSGSNAYSGGWVTSGALASHSDYGDGSIGQGRDIKVSSDSIYVVDNSANRILKYDLATGAFIGWIGKIKTVGGTCTAGVGNFTGGWCSGGNTNWGTGNGTFWQPTSMVIDEANNRLYANDSNRVQSFNLATGAFIGWIGSIGTAGGTCTAGVGNFSGGWCSGGAAGSSSGSTLNGGFNSYPILEIDITGQKLLAFNNSVVARYDLATGAFLDWMGGVGSHSSCIAGQASGQWCAAGGAGSAGASAGYFQNSYLFLDSTNNLLYTADTQNGRLQKFNYATAAYLGTTGIYSAHRTQWSNSGYGNWDLATGTGIAIDVESDLAFLADTDQSKIVKLKRSTGEILGAYGKISEQGGTCLGAVGTASGWCLGGKMTSGSGTGFLSQPYGLATAKVAGTTYLYVADSGNHRIVKINASTGVEVGWIGKILTTGGTCTAGVGLFTGGWCLGGTSQTGNGIGMLANPRGVTVSSTLDVLLVADYNNNRIQKFKLSTGEFLGWTGTCDTGSVCTSGSGKSTAGWSVDGIPRFPNADGHMQRPVGVILDESKSFFYMTDYDSYEVKKYSLTTGALLGWIGAFWQLGGTCVSPLIITSGSIKYSSQWCLGGLSEYGTSDLQFGRPSAIALDNVRDFLYVHDASNSRLKKFKLSTGEYLGWMGHVDSGNLPSNCSALGSNSNALSWCLGGGSSTDYSKLGVYGYDNEVGLAVDALTGDVWYSDSQIQKLVQYE